MQLLFSKEISFPAVRHSVPPSIPTKRLGAAVESPKSAWSCIPGAGKTPQPRRGGDAGRARRDVRRMRGHGSQIRKGRGFISVEGRNSSGVEQNDEAAEPSLCERRRKSAWFALTVRKRVEKV